LVRRRWWSGCLGGGVALGLAIMAKGPVALVFTIAPLAIYALMCRRRIHWLAALAGAVVASIIAIPWFVSAMLNTPGTLEAWKSELTNEGARNISRDPWFAHLSLLPHTLPWMPLFLAGVYLVLQPLFRRRNRPALRSAAQSRQPSGAGTATGSPGRSIPGCRMFLALILVLAPLLILSFSRDRKPRYLLPMAGPIAILAAHAVVRMGRAARQTDAASAIVWTQGGVLAAFVLGLPIAGAFFLKLPDGAPWYSRSLTIIALTIGLTALAAGAIWARNSALRGPDTARHLAPWRFMATGALLMLALNVFFALGWSRSTDGLSEMKPAADAILQHLPAGRVVYYDPHPGAKPVILDLDIYLDRTVPNEDPTLSRARDIAAVVALRLPGAPPPALPGWKTVFDYTEQKHQHHWYVLGPQPDQ